MNSLTFQIRFIYRATTYTAEAIRYTNHFNEVYYMVQELRPFRRMESNIFSIDRNEKCFEFTGGYSPLKLAIAHAIEKACSEKNLPCFEIEEHTIF